MIIRKSRRMLALSGIAPVLLAGALGGGVILARAENGTPTAPTTGVQAQQARANPMDAFIKDLAANLNIPEQTLRDALKKTASGELDKLVASGKLTKEQADKIRERIAQGNGSFFMPSGAGPRGGPGAHPGGAGPMGAGIGIAFDNVAKFLRIDAATLKSDLASGKSLAQEAIDKGSTRDALKQFLITDSNARIDQLAKDGKITATIAADLKQRFAANLDRMIDATHKAMGPGGMKPRGNGAPSMPGMPGAPRLPGTN